jgi:hypothetical protein
VRFQEAQASCSELSSNPELGSDVMGGPCHVGLRGAAPPAEEAAPGRGRTDEVQGEPPDDASHSLTSLTWTEKHPLPRGTQG